MASLNKRLTCSQDVVDAILSGQIQSNAHRKDLGKLILVIK